MFEEPFYTFSLANPSYGMVSHSIALPQVEKKNAFASPG